MYKRKLGKIVDEKKLDLKNNWANNITEYKIDFFLFQKTIKNFVTGIFGPIT